MILWLLYTLRVQSHKYLGAPLSYTIPNDTLFYVSFYSDT